MATTGRPDTGTVPDRTGRTVMGLLGPGSTPDLATRRVQKHPGMRTEGPNSEPLCIKKGILNAFPHVPYDRVISSDRVICQTPCQTPVARLGTF